MTVGGDICLYIIAFLLPPVAVVIKRGCGAQVLINIVLCFFGYFPSIIHAF